MAFAGDVEGSPVAGPARVPEGERTGVNAEEETGGEGAGKSEEGSAGGRGSLRSDVSGWRDRRRWCDGLSGGGLFAATGHQTIRSSPGMGWLPAMSWWFFQRR